MYAHTCTPDVAGADFYSVLPLQLVIQTGVRGLTAQNLLQEVLFLHSYQKQGRLLEVLRSTQQPPVLVFANSISTVNEVTRLLREEQFHVVGLHSEMEQSDRFAVMAAFRKGERGGSLPSRLSLLRQMTHAYRESCVLSVHGWSACCYCTVVCVSMGHFLGGARGAG